MEPNPTKFPMLSYVMSRIPHFGPKPSFDIEQAQASHATNNAQLMPQLNDPEVIKSMKLAISEVSQTRSVLQSLGDRPDHESVDTARTKIAEIEANLSQKMEEIVLSPKPEEKEKECREEAEKEREIYKAVVRLDELHEAYENLLRDAENRLQKIYYSAVAAGKGVEEKVEVLEEDEVNEEVIEILRKAEKGLERVELPERKLRFLPEEFGKLRGLVALNLSRNELVTVPDSIAGLERLEELYLSSNLLESLPDSIGLLFNLKILDVSSNKLKVLPDSISHCRSLVQLEVGYNSLAYLPTSIGYELVNLSRLSIQYNKIRSFPTSICEMRSLRYMDAHFNELHSLPYAIGRLTNLEILNLSSNFSDLRELPNTFGDLINLRELDLSNNQIHALPNTFGRLDNLNKLNLEQNPLVIPPMDIVNNGVEAVKEFMTKRWHDILLEEELRSRAEEHNEEQAGWLKRSTSLVTRSTSLLTKVASTVSDSVTEYLRGGANSPRDPYLDQDL